MLMTVFAGIAEFEQDLIRERTKAGRMMAKSRGVKFGRPQKIRTEQKSLINHLLREGKSIKEIALTFSIHPSTIYRNIKITRVMFKVWYGLFDGLRVCRL